MAGKRARRVIALKVLPGEPTDGTGRNCIHLLVPDQSGPFVEPHVLHPALDEAGQPVKRKLVARATRARLACDPRRTVAPAVRGNVTTVTARTDDPRAVTCAKCLASADYRRMMSRFEGV